MAQKSTFRFKERADTERIAKRIARAGICSRRDAESRIAEGRVYLNGERLDTPATLVTADDVIHVDGKLLPNAEGTRLWRYYKPRGLVVSARDEQGRETIFDHLPETMPRVITVGRLDLDSEGLLLLTNDGELARHLELPSTGWIRKYRVRVQGRVNEEELASLADGITIHGIHYDSLLARLDKQLNSNAWLTVAIREGKNREIRRVMEALGYRVSRLIRLSYGPFQLGTMEDGDVQEVKQGALMDQLGMTEPEDRGPTLSLKRGQKRKPKRSFHKSGAPNAGQRKSARSQSSASKSDQRKAARPQADKFRSSRSKP